MHSEQKKKVLITGASGLLGSNLAFCWKDYFSVLGFYNHHAAHIPGTMMEQVDLLNVEVLEKKVQQFKPDIIVHCAALADIDQCEENHALAEMMNVGLVRNVTRLAEKFGIRLVYISTDAVYGGTKGKYTEEDGLSPLNYYTQTKIKGEVIAAALAGSLIIRTSFYGWNIQKGKTSLAEWVINQLSQGKVIKGFVNVISSNIYTQDLALILKEMIDRHLTGVFNLGCRQGMSKYNFAIALATRLNLPTQLIEPYDVDHFSFKAPRGKDLSLSVSRLELALGRALPEAQDCIKNFLRDRDLWKR